MSARIGIVGGGVLGLSLAYRLAEAGHDVVVFERGEQPGGLATWYDFGPFVWDEFYHVVTPTDRDLVAFFRELGLGDELQMRPSRMGFLWNERLLSMSTYAEFLTFPALSLWHKLRLGLGILYTTTVRESAALEEETSERWLRRVFGSRVFEVMWAPLLASKFGVLAPRVPASLIVATIKRVFGMRSKSDGSEQLGYLHGGYRTFLERIVTRISEHGSEVRLGVQVEAIRGAGGRAYVDTPEGSEAFDRVISTVPKPLFRRLASDVTDMVGGEGGEPAFLGVVCLALVLRRSLCDFYVTNLIQSELPFTGIVEYTALADGEAEMAGHHLVYLPRYETPDSEWFRKTDDEIREGGLDALERIWPDIRSDVVSASVHRRPHVQAVWLPGTARPTDAPHSAGSPIESVTAELVGLDTLNNDAIVRLANREAARLVAELA